MKTKPRKNWWSTLYHIQLTTIHHPITNVLMYCVNREHNVKRYAFIKPSQQWRSAVAVTKQTARVLRKLLHIVHTFNNNSNKHNEKRWGVVALLLCSTWRIFVKA